MPYVTESRNLLKVTEYTATYGKFIIRERCLELTAYIHTKIRKIKIILSSIKALFEKKFKISQCSSIIIVPR